jgi:hypothetical protein
LTLMIMVSRLAVASRSPIVFCETKTNEAALGGAAEATGRTR